MPPAPCLEAEERPIPAEMKPFEPTRVVVNFKLLDSREEGKPVTEFKPPFELWVQYTDQEEEDAEKLGETLQLAYWNGDYWVRFKEDDHRFDFKDDSEGRKYGVAHVSEWTDPPIAWGT